jgi:hypothetical protein
VLNNFQANTDAPYTLEFARCCSFDIEFVWPNNAKEPPRVLFANGRFSWPPFDPALNALVTGLQKTI